MMRKFFIFLFFILHLGVHGIVYGQVSIYAPWPCGVSYYITQGNNGPSHDDIYDRYAWDIGMKVGSAIAAPADGIITHVDVRFNQTCSSLCNEVNILTMTMDNGRSASFLHLKHLGSNKRVGDRVKQGDIIAYSGNTGYTTGPHLHFQVQEVCGRDWCHSVKANWVGFGVPRTSQIIVSNNCPIVCEPSEEICDSKDNDCDGKIDEDGVCDYTEEVYYQSHLYGIQNTDIDGDGKADICGRGANGLHCAFSSGKDTGNGGLVIGDLKNDSGWIHSKYFTGIRFADINGDGKADVCARGSKEFYCWKSEGRTFQKDPIAIGAFSDESGWSVAHYMSSLSFADVNGDGKDDVCGRGSAGLRCYKSTGQGFDFENPLSIGEKGLSDEYGWSGLMYYGSIRYADVNGDGKFDVCGRASDGVYCWLSDGNKFVKQVVGPKWSNEGGWGEDKHWSTIQYPDINGDGMADVCARSAKGIICHFSKGESFGEEIVGPKWSNEGGWDRYDNYSTIRYGDINGDGKDDVCGRADAGIVCALSTGSGFENIFRGPEMSDKNGWGGSVVFRSIRMADVNGDGKMDLCGRHGTGVHCYLSQGNSFSSSVLGPQWTDANGWNGALHYTTFRVGGLKWGKIIGTVYDSVVENTKAAKLEGVKVKLNGNLELVSDHEGAFSFRSRAGVHKLSAIKEGWEESKVDCRLWHGGVVRCDIFMKKVNTSVNMGKIEGIVYGGEKGSSELKKLEGVDLVLSSGASHRSDSNGHFMFDVAVGQYKVKARRLGWKNAESDCGEVKVGEVVHCDVYMKKGEDNGGEIIVPDDKGNDDPQSCPGVYISELKKCCIPEVEICDGRDNDCDNEIDEKGACDEGYDPFQPQDGSNEHGYLPEDELQEKVKGDCSIQGVMGSKIQFMFWLCGIFVVLYSVRRFRRGCRY